MESSWAPTLATNDYVADMGCEDSDILFFKLDGPFMLA